MLPIGEILDGWKHFLIRTPVTEKVAKERARICASCEYSGEVIHNNLHVKGCTECGCPLAFKTRSMKSSCPHPDGPKWKSFKK